MIDYEVGVGNKKSGHTKQMCRRNQRLKAHQKMKPGELFSLDLLRNLRRYDIIDWEVIMCQEGKDFTKKSIKR